MDGKWCLSWSLLANREKSMLNLSSCVGGRVDGKSSEDFRILISS